MFKAFADKYIPDYEIESFENITDEILDKLKYDGIKAIFLDVDGTITKYYDIEISKDAESFLKRAKDKEIELCLVTNCDEKRYCKVYSYFGFLVDFNVFWPGYFESYIPHFISKKINRKPFRQAYLNAAEKLGIPIEKCAMIGDQYSTDIWGAKRAGIRKTIKINNSLSSNEPKKKKWQRKFENEIYRRLLKYTDKRPEKI